MCKTDNIGDLSDDNLDTCKDVWFDQCHLSEKIGRRDDDFCDWIEFHRHDSSPLWSSPDGEDMFRAVFDAACDGESYDVPDDEEEFYKEEEHRNLVAIE